MSLFMDIINDQYQNHIVATESSSILDDDKFRAIIEFNNTLNQFEYCIPNNGNYIRRVTAKDYMKFYKMLSPHEFIKYNGGVCWDYVAYEAWYFKKFFSNIKFETFYMVMNNLPSQPTHTFLIFEYIGNFYWFESSWKKQAGIYGFHSRNDAINYVMNLLKGSGSSCYEKNRSSRLGTNLCTFDASDKCLYGLDVNGYMNYMSLLIRPYTFKKSSEPFIVIKGHVPENQEASI